MRFVVVFLAVWVTGCSATAPRAPAPLPAFPFEPLAVLDGDVSEAQIAPLAPVEVTTAPNRHVPGATVTYRSYVFDRTRVTFLDARPESRQFIESVETWDPAVRTPAGIGVGSTRAEVEAAFGDRTTWSSDAESAYVYADRDGVRDRLMVTVGYGEEDRARHLTLRWDID